MPSNDRRSGRIEAARLLELAADRLEATTPLEKAFQDCQVSTLRLAVDLIREADATWQAAPIPEASDEAV